MPARHDLLCGALDFLWKPWGSIEIWEEPLTVPLRRAGVVTKLVSDHPHLFETGGENYHVDFTAWDYQRGHESDMWRTRPDPSWQGAPSFGRVSPYDNSRGWFQGEEDFPGPRTMKAAARWLAEEAPEAPDRFFLLVDEFDPHEPFDTPEPYASMYDDGWEGPHLVWPPYAVGAVAKGVISEREGHQIRAQYGAKLTMIDHWFGRIVEQLDKRGLWEDTAVVLCTDHGHYLGEKDMWGKPGVPPYETLGHTPLMVSWPGIGAGSRDALTTNVDLHATIADVFGVAVEQRTHGSSLVPLMADENVSIRDYALGGVWANEVQIVTSDGHKYARAPIGENAPLSMWSNRWSTMPVNAFPDLRLPRPDGRAFLDRMPGSDVPVIRQPFLPGDPLPFWAYADFDGNRAYSIGEDPNEENNLAGSVVEDELSSLLREALKTMSAPDDQFERLGLE